MNSTMRPATPQDADACGLICYQAFKVIAEAHHFPPDFPDAAAAAGLMQFAFSHEQVYAVVAEQDGRIVGSNMLWENSLIGGVGPITVDPACQNAAIGRQLMEQVLQRAADSKLAGLRLVQAAYHNRTMALYTKLGFDVQEPLSVMQGSPLSVRIPGYNVRPATETDIEPCDQLCYAVHGHQRSSELLGAIKAGTATVAEQEGIIAGYSTGIGFFGHTVAATNNGLKALIGAAQHFPGPGFLLPTRNGEVLRWCLHKGLRVVQPMTLMSKGLYNQPAGAFMPSVLF